MSKSLFSQPVIDGTKLVAIRFGLETAALLAVAEVESGGQVFAVVDGREEPLIRFEGHYFDKRLTLDQQKRARALGLSSPRAGGVKNPSSQAARWALLKRAIAINPQAAYESCSWGLGQVMGAHWKVLGFKSVDQLVTMARGGAVGQIELVARYIVNFDLARPMKYHDWSAFARGYNGPGYRTNRYDTKLADAYVRYAGGAPVTSAAGMLRLGSQGAAVRELQTLLRRAGATVAVDGDFGPATKTAVEAFQAKAGQTQDGLAGPETMAALTRYRQDPAEDLAAMPAMDVPAVQNAAKGLAPLAVIMSIRDQVADLAMQLTGIDLAAAQTVANGLLAVSSAIGVGLAVYGLVGWFKSRRTYVGTGS